MLLDHVNHHDDVIANLDFFIHHVLSAMLNVCKNIIMIYHLVATLTIQFQDGHIPNTFQKYANMMATTELYD